ncbi:DNA replication and repair protein recF [Propionibacterium australiense]|uniref:DNA replication and repair protein RecF n=1 Tax=Propionibacterium australiense TaxID=119981 RepID=A0A383S6T0_9ACTN|nr:DNA replication/repair protein RecF [Propionibacterium australiense]RLP08591.1 DNA replication/repair protein RecF [Propionibacterium australiense]SYZ33627.1 DNA-binding, RecF, conserved site [Propionibacterium australiense]VEH88828.1 DNA replication and repair protein recF [Propionibacterium australiense]
MFVDHLELVDFRSYRAVSLTLGPGVNVLVGPNGHGKTNLVEAVEYLATLSSHRVASDAPLLRAGAGQAIIRAVVVAGLDDPRRLLLEIELNAGRANRARINRVPQRRVRDLVGALRAVVFSPEDLAIVKGDPADRRGFLDALVITRWPRMAAVKADYERALRQRNALLKQLAKRGGRLDDGAAATLDVWDERLAGLGAELLAARLATLADLAAPTRAAYAAIAPVNNEARARYTSSLPHLGELTASGDDGRPGAPDEGVLSGLLLQHMAARRHDECVRGVSLVGPHRDDIDLHIGALPAKGYASHGESWSLALALRLGSLTMLRAEGVEPVLVLDDVFAELDSTRRDRLADAVLDAEQVLVTAAVDADVPAQLTGRRLEVFMRDEPAAVDSGVPSRVSMVSGEGVVDLADAGSGDADERSREPADAEGGRATDSRAPGRGTEGEQ